jgi:hypothetical protein
MHLVRCPSCSVHVRSDEVACPFCRAALSAGWGASLVARLGIAAGLSLVAFLSVSACAYGCPDGTCGPPIVDAGPDAAPLIDAARPADASAPPDVQ